jgi:tetratricopeptide (TPR) repeat protein
MATPKSTARLLRRILKERSFDQLAPFRNVAFSRQLAPTERQLAAQLLTLQGREQLQQSQPDWRETLGIALQVAPPEAVDVWEQQGELWLELARTRATADSAQRALQLYGQVVEQAPSRFQGWWGYARALMENCPQRPCLDLLHKAADALEKARSLLPPNNEALTCDVHWHAARVRAALAQHTQEASDWAQAASLYKQTHSQQPDYWLEYAQTLLQLNRCTGLKAPICYAAEALEKAVRSGSPFNAWQLLQQIAERWALSTLDAEPFDWAVRLLRHLARRQKQDDRLRLCWGQLLLHAARVTGNEALLREAMEKLDAASRLGTPEPLVAASNRSWAQAAASFGLATDKLKWIGLAQERLDKALALSSTEPGHEPSEELLLSQGLVLMWRALFFLDAGQMQQAVERLRAVAEQGDQPTCWYWLASSLLHQAELGQEDMAAREAVDCIQHAINRERHCIHYWQLSGEALMRCGELDQSVPLLQRAATAFAQALELVEPEKAPAELLYHYGSTLDLLGERTNQASHDDQAIELLRGAVRRDRQAIPILLALSAALHRIGDERNNPQLLYEALLQLLDAMRDEPDEGALWGQAGAICLTLWRMQTASESQSPSSLLLDRSHEYLTQAALLGAAQAHLYLATLHALMLRHELAIESLDRAERYGALPPLEELLRDDWFEPLRASPLFKAWLEKRLQD